MATARVRAGWFYIDFRYKGIRCQEATHLRDTRDNRAAVKIMVRQIDGALAGDTFDYRAWFPRGKRAHLFRAPGDDGPPRYADYARAWFDDMAARKARGTVYDQRRILEGRLIPAFGARRVSELRADHVEAFVASLKAPTAPRKLGNRRVNIILQLLRSSLDRAVHRGWLDKNPAREVAKLREERADIDPLTLEEVTTLLAKGVASADDRRYLTVAFFTGLRPSEQMGLRWDDVDWIRKTVSVRRAVGRFGDGPTKTVDSRREVELLPDAETALRAQRRASGLRGPWVFCNSVGGPLNLTNFRGRVWTPALRRAGLRRRTFYQTKHTFVTLMLERGYSPVWIARQVGHTTPEMIFRRYYRFTEHAKQRPAPQRWLEGEA